MKTIIELWNGAVLKYGSNDFFYEKIQGKYKGHTYKEINESVKGFAVELIDSGVEFGDRVSIIAMGSRDWVVAELGILFSACVSVPLSPKMDIGELKFRLEHSDTKIVVVGANQYNNLIDMLNSIPAIKKIILLGTRDSYKENEIFIGDFIASGKAKNKDGVREDTIAKAVLPIVEDTLAILSYTSGTTADPKGVMLSHKNMYVNTEQSLSLYPIREDDVMLLILPIDHSFAHTAGLYTFMSAGAALASVDQGKSAQDLLKNISINIKEVKPTILLSVPALAKSFRKSIESGVKLKGPTAQKLFAKGLQVAYKYIGNGWDMGKGWRMFYALPYKFYDKLLFSKIRKNFGGRLSNFVGGGAMLDVELQRFFMALGMPMFQGYGLSETAPVISANNFEKKKFGSSGQLVENLELKIIDDEGQELPIGTKGEICVKGENVMLGYFKNPSSTAETIVDNWLHTGDLGYIDEDGFVYVLGRFKSLLISADGEKYSPEGIEDSLPSNCSYIEQTMLYNDHKPYTIALIYPNATALKHEIEKKNIDIASDEAVVFAIKRIQQALNEYLPGGKYKHLFLSRWIPTTFAVLDEGFAEKNTFLNSNLKMVRTRITEHYAGLIDSLYTPQGKSVMNENNKINMRKLLG